LLSAPNNLALGKTVTASSVADNDPAAYAVDGESGTRWSSAYTDSEWICVDLGAIHRLAGGKLSWETAFARAYKIQVSNDGTAWTDVHATTHGQGGVETIPFTAQGRYVRMFGQQRATTYGYSLWEFEVYGQQ